MADIERISAQQAHTQTKSNQTLPVNGSLFGWLTTLYPLWSRLDAEAAYLSAWIGLAELAQATGVSISEVRLGLRRLAEQLGEGVERAGLSVRVQSTLDYRFQELGGESLLFVVMSTHGDGEAPDEARAFVDFLTGRRAPNLEKLAYSVLALGDSSYPKYCQAGRLIDERLAVLGARRLSPRLDCDVDYERPAGAWLALIIGT